MVLDLVEAIGPRYGALLLTMGFCSLRTGEVFGLRRCDVDPLHGEVHVLVQAQELTGMGRTVLDHAKTDAGLRTVSVPSFVMDVLVSHLAEYTGPEAEAPVFTGPRTRRYDERRSPTHGSRPRRRSVLPRTCARSTCGTTQER